MNDHGSEPTQVLDERPLIGYSNALAVHPGADLRVMVSSAVGDYTADLVRLLGGPGASGNAASEEAVEGALHARLGGAPQATAVGSYMRAPLGSGHGLGEAVTVAAWIYPTRQAGAHAMGVVSLSDAEGTGFLALATLPSGETAVIAPGRDGDEVLLRSGVAARLREWYFVAASWTAGTIRLRQAPLSRWLAAEERRVESSPCVDPVYMPRELLVGALAVRRDHTRPARVDGPFNGKIAAPVLWSAALEFDALEAVEAGASPLGIESDRLVGAWDFSVDPAAAVVIDAGPHDRSGMLHGGPTRAVTGPAWTGSMLDFRSAPREYNAVHFHDDDVEDAGWDVALELGIPGDLRSGVYAIRLVSGEFEDRVPFIVSPRPGQQTARTALLMPTLTYVAYANRHYADELLLAALEENAGAGSLGELERYAMEHPELGLSLYDSHSDGSQVYYASLLRPLLPLRPGYVSSILGTPRHFSADLTLLSWFADIGVGVDVISDHDLHRYGTQLLASYDVLASGSHPEYCTAAMLDAVDTFVHSGGRVMYLGGNGFYAVASLSDQRPHLLEVRRTAGSGHFGRLEPGEGHSSLTGEPGGIWRNRGRPPQRLVGVGTAAWGLGPASPYERTPESFDAHFSWAFDGLDEATSIGMQGPLGGAAGDELDRSDAALGTPPTAHVLATSRGKHTDGYESVPEERALSGQQPPPGSNPLIRADLVIVEAPSGGAVFSVGSIAWVIALSDPDISRVTANVLTRFLSRDEVPQGTATGPAALQ